MADFELTKKLYALVDKAGNDSVATKSDEENCFCVGLADCLVAVTMLRSAGLLILAGYYS